MKKSNVGKSYRGQRNVLLVALLLVLMFMGGYFFCSRMNISAAALLSDAETEADAETENNGAAETSDSTSSEVDGSAAANTSNSNGTSSSNKGGNKGTTSSNSAPSNRVTEETLVAVVEEMDLTPEVLEEMSDEELETVLGEVFTENDQFNEGVAVEDIRVSMDDIVRAVEEANRRRWNNFQQKAPNDTKSDVGVSTVETVGASSNVNPDDVRSTDITERANGIVTEQKGNDGRTQTSLNIQVKQEAKKDICRIYSPSGVKTEVELQANQSWSSVQLGDEAGDWTINLYSWIDGSYHFVHQYTVTVGQKANTQAVAQNAQSVQPEPETPVAAQAAVVETPVVETPAVVETPVVETPAVVETPVVEEVPAAPAVEERIGTENGFADWF